MKKIPKNLQDEFFTFLSVIGYQAKMNSDSSMVCINPRAPKERRQIVIWRDGKMNKACQLVWTDFLNHWLVIGREFIEALKEKVA